jgi:hypothetical protein
MRREKMKREEMRREGEEKRKEKDATRASSLCLLFHPFVIPWNKWNTFAKKYPHSHKLIFAQLIGRHAR